MKVTAAAVLLALATCADAFGPVRPSVVRSVVDAAYLNAIAGYLDNLSPTTQVQRNPVQKPKPKSGGGGGYLDNLTSVANGRPVLTGAGGGATSSYMDSISQMNGASWTPASAAPAAPAAPAAAWTPAPANPSAAAPSGAGTGGYLSSLPSNKSGGSGAGLSGYLQTLPSNSGVRGSGAAQAGYLQALTSNTSIRGSGTAQQGYLSTISATSAPVAPRAPSAPSAPTVKPVAGPAIGSYLDNLQSSTSVLTGTGSSFAGYLASLNTKNTYRTPGSTPAGTGYLDTLVSKNAVRAIRTGGQSLGGYLDNLARNTASTSTVAAVSANADADEYLQYLRDASSAAKNYLTYLEGAVASAKDYLAYFESAKRA
jgi:hypothetical protein